MHSRFNFFFFLFYFKKLTLISSTNIYDDDNLTIENLPENPPLLIFTSTIEDGSLVENDNGKNSFIMTKKLHNGVNKNKDVQNKIFVSYNNEGGRYNSLRNVVKKGAFSVIGKLIAEGQTYVAMSQAPSLDKLQIVNSDYSQLEIPRAALEEYKRLEIVNRNGLQSLM